MEKIAALPGLLSDAMDVGSDLPYVGDSFKSAADGAGALEQNIRGFADGMRDFVSVVDYVDVETGGLTERQKQLNQQFAEGDKVIRQISHGYKGLQDATEGAAGAKEKLNELERKAKQIYEETRTPLEKLQEKLAELQALYEKGYLTLDTYQRGVQKAYDDLNKLGDKAGDAMDTVRRESKDAADDMIKSFSDAIFGIGELDLGGSFKRMFAQINSDILQGTLKSVLYGKDGKSGLLGGLLGDVLGTGTPGQGGGASMPQGVQAGQQTAEAFAKTAGPSLADQFTGNMDGFFNSLGELFGTGGGGFLGMLQQVFSGAGSLFNSIFSGLGSSLSGLFSGIFGGGGSGGLFGGLFSAISGLFGGFFADGGTVTPRRAYVVGERGPELFIPNRVGGIVPNGAYGMGGAPVQVFMNVSTPDVRSFRQSQSQITADLARQIERSRRNL